MSKEELQKSPETKAIAQETEQLIGTKQFTILEDHIQKIPLENVKDVYDTITKKSGYKQTFTQYLSTDQAITLLNHIPLENKKKFVHDLSPSQAEEMYTKLTQEKPTIQQEFDKKLEEERIKEGITKSSDRYDDLSVILGREKLIPLQNNIAFLSEAMERGQEPNIAASHPIHRKAAYSALSEGNNDYTIPQDHYSNPQKQHHVNITQDPVYQEVNEIRNAFATNQGSSSKDNTSPTKLQARKTIFKKISDQVQKMFKRNKSNNPGR